MAENTQDLQTLVVRLVADVSKLKEGMSEGKRQTKDFEGNLGTLGERMDRIRIESGRLDSAFKGLALGGVGLAIKGLKDIVSTSVTFESKMLRVKALAGATESDFKRLSDAAVALGSKTVFSASEAAEGMQSLAAAGYSTQQVLQAMPGLLDAAAASGDGFAKTADVLVASLGGFQLGADKATHVADVLAAAANEARTDIAGMGEAFKYAAPSAYAFGVSIEETAAAAVIMNKAGLGMSQVGEYLRGTFSQLAKPSKEAAELIENLGLKFFDAQGKFIGLSALTEQLQDKLGRLTLQQRSHALATIFGTEASTALLALMAAGAPKVEQYATQFTKVDGASRGMAETMNSGVMGAVSNLTGAIESASIKLGQLMLPSIKETTQSASGLVSAVGDLTTEFVKFATASEGSWLGEIVRDLNDGARAAGNFTSTLAAGLKVYNAFAAAKQGKVDINSFLSGGLDLAIGLADSDVLKWLVKNTPEGVADPLGELANKATGGLITDGTGPTADDVLIRVSKGETVVPADDSSRPEFRAWAGMRGIPGFASGGRPGASGGSPAGSGSYDPMINWAAVQAYYSQIAKQLMAEEKAREKLTREVEQSIANMGDFSEAANLLNTELKGTSESAKFFEDSMLLGTGPWATPSAESIRDIVTALGQPVPGIGTGTKSTNKDENKEWTVADLIDLRGNYSDPVAGRNVDPNSIAGQMLADWQAGQFNGGQPRGGQGPDGYGDWMPPGANPWGGYGDFRPGGANPGQMEDALYNTYGAAYEAQSPQAMAELADLMSGIERVTSKTATNFDKINTVFDSINYELLSQQMGGMDLQQLFPHLDSREIQHALDMWLSGVKAMGLTTVTTTGDFHELIKAQQDFKRQLLDMEAAAGGVSRQMNEEAEKRREAEDRLFSMGLSAEQVQRHMAALYPPVAAMTAAINAAVPGIAGLAVTARAAMGIGGGIPSASAASGLSVPGGIGSVLSSATRRALAGGTGLSSGSGAMGIGGGGYAGTAAGSGVGGDIVLKLDETEFGRLAGVAIAKANKNNTVKMGQSRG